ncbi:hypothetical protein Cni_G28938 [Canna indica]|uniref:Endonuclease/exonuclease/phosphatase domain-containing protein n=1 Tax=Canna indica TaxID=4628 RepID=A0AAQ3QP74_9LILI|nr:hypothetical protein Cni_G28938 [Canna indica]
MAFETKGKQNMIFEAKGGSDVDKQKLEKENPGKEIYASTNMNKTKLLWEGLNSLDIGEIPCLVVGDMNSIMKASEKRGGRLVQNNHAVTDFKSWINNCRLIDTSFSGPCFTWTNKRKGSRKISTRLDRAFYNSAWLDWKYEFKSIHLNMIDSDHRPIMVNCNESKKVRRKNRYDFFVFEHFWLEYPDLKKLIDEFWRKNNGEMKPMMLNIENLKDVLIEWNRNCVGNLKRNLEQIKELEKIELKEKLGLASQEEIFMMRALSNELHGCS